MSKESSKRLAKIAAVGIKHPEALTFDGIKSLSACVLAQKEKDKFEEAVQAAVEAKEEA